MTSGYAAIVGWTNVGKSTLLNRLVGVKLSAVADVAQTTRRRIEGTRTLAGRGQIVFVDTPGLHEPRHRMNRSMIESAREALGGVDVVLLVFDASTGFGPGDARAAELVREAGVARIAVPNKIDLVHPKAKLLPLIERLRGEGGFAEIVPVSALDGDGCDRLIDRVLASLPEGELLFPDDHLTDQPERVLAAEWIREQLLRETREELPHATAVVVESYAERPDGLLEISAQIVVERESQKKIVIGAGGSMIRRVGIAARAELERFLGRRIHLALWVKVRPRWRDDPRALRDLGLE